MGLTPGYGETPLEGDEPEALNPEVLRILGESFTKSAIYDLETALYSEARERLLSEIDHEKLTVPDLLTPSFLIELHTTLFGGIWKWAGRFRRTMLNIGVAPNNISSETFMVCGNLNYRWEEALVTSPHDLGVCTHAEFVRIHPFVDGNGRVTRLLADLVFAAGQTLPHTLEYDWDIDKQMYIQLLRTFDLNRDPQPLCDFIQSQACGGGR